MKATAKRVLATLAGRKEILSERELPYCEAPAPSMADAVTSECVALAPEVDELRRIIDSQSGGAKGLQRPARLDAMRGLEIVSRRSPAQANELAQVVFRGELSQGRVITDLIALAREAH